MSPPRIGRLKDEPLKMSEFVTALANTPCVFAEEYEKMLKFTDDVCGFKEKREQKASGKEPEVKKDPKKKK